MFQSIQLDTRSDAPLYRQLFQQLKLAIDSGRLADGSRLPATREMAGLLGLNRSTVSAAYALLETEGLIAGHVGRGSFVTRVAAAPPGRLDWRSLLEPAAAPAASYTPPARISFSSSRPLARLFPIEDFRASSDEVTHSDQLGSILQLGSPTGYAPLRQRLLDEARAQGTARTGDDILITSGCQQALDLLDRVLLRPGQTVAIEDPVYPGIRNLFQMSGAHLATLPVRRDGVAPDEFTEVLAREKPRVVVLTPNFQNPTGATIPEPARRAILRQVRASGAVLIENDIYGALRYHGEEQPTFKQLDEAGDTVQLRSFSKISFPGLRVGWIIAPQPLIARLAEAKLRSDLHTDQLAQAILLRFLESGRLARHVERALEAGRQRLAAALNACARYLPEGSLYTRPQGGMNLWVELPAAVDTLEMLDQAHRRGVSYLPGRDFGVARPHSNALRLSFAGLEPEEIEDGLAILGEVFRNQIEKRFHQGLETAPAIV